jgi:hypothetical protein
MQYIPARYHRCEQSAIFWLDGPSTSPPCGSERPTGIGLHWAKGSLLRPPNHGPVYRLKTGRFGRARESSASRHSHHVGPGFRSWDHSAFLRDRGVCFHYGIIEGPTGNRAHAIEAGEYA